MLPEKSTYLASPSVISPSMPGDETVDLELEQLNQSHGVVSEDPCKLISWGNKSTGNATVEQGVSRDEACNRATTLLGDKTDTDNIRCNDRCGIHEHLLFDILLWLPVISLLRFKSVCKSWCALINSSTFITQQFSHNCSKDLLLALCEPFNEVHSKFSSPNIYGYHCKFCLLGGSKYEVHSILDYEEHWCSFSILTSNSCNGIVMKNTSDGAGKPNALWNPATKQLRYLPETSDLLPCNENNRFGGALGLGFDVRSKDYKVIRVSFEIKNPLLNIVEIYSLRTDSWRTIHKNDVLPFRYIDSGNPVCKKGKCFWVGVDVEYSPILISFDWSDEIFETMSLPEEPSFSLYEDRHYLRYQALDFLNDKLAYIKGVDHCIYDSYHIYFEIWVSDESDGKESWHKLCKIGPTGSRHLDALNPKGFSKDGEVLLLGYGRGTQLQGLCNFDDIREGENLKVEEFEDHVNYVRYNESLVSLKRENGA